MAGLVSSTARLSWERASTGTFISRAMPFSERVMAVISCTRFSILVCDSIS